VYLLHATEVSHADLVVQTPEGHESDDIGRIPGSVQLSRAAFVELQSQSLPVTVIVDSPGGGFGQVVLKTRDGAVPVKPRSPSHGL
jgi:hypothetical protein